MGHVSFTPSDTSESDEEITTLLARINLVVMLGSESPLALPSTADNEVVILIPNMRNSDLTPVDPDLDPAAYADFAMGWVAQGATIVGGCCEVGPDHLAELVRRLRAAAHDLV